ncbi:MAG: Asp-tRNA(Asn)/Glu-tRNA(Gln) amidotransferase subunit GatC [Candidatus Kerfeldbacteria bacterium]|nr:Asp-tRNA(Asn)/Glu-tRNA(Gln) amidotransferase subunit GatC [Candidatus Kerfeldbacteria bacterium]
MTIIEPADVEHIATLARLLLTPDEVTRFSGQLSSILDYVAKLNELPTDGVEPTRQVTDHVNGTRSDIVREQTEPTRRAILEQAPELAEDGFRVPPVFV